MNRLLAFTLLCSALAASGAQAQVFKCVDASGKAAYSQSPCPASAKSKTIASRPAAAASETERKPAAKAPDDFRKRQADKEDAEKKAAEKTAELKVKQENCQRAKQNMAQFDAGGRISRFNDKGEREVLDDAQIAQERSRAKTQVDQLCSG